jgi:RNA polymerase primary sigma factor
MGDAYTSATAEAPLSSAIPVQALLAARTAIQADLIWPHDPRQIGIAYEPYIEQIGQALEIDRRDALQPRRLFSLIRDGATRAEAMAAMAVDDKRHMELLSDIPILFEAAALRHIIPDVRGPQSTLQAALIDRNIAATERAILEAYALGISREQMLEMFGARMLRTKNMYDPDNVLRRYLPRLQEALGNDSPLLADFPPLLELGKTAARVAKPAPPDVPQVPPSDSRHPKLRLVKSAKQQARSRQGAASAIPAQRAAPPKLAIVAEPSVTPAIAAPKPKPAPPKIASKSKSPLKKSVSEARSRAPEQEDIVPERIRERLLRPDEEIELGQKIQRGRRANIHLEKMKKSGQRQVAADGQFITRDAAEADVAAGKTAFWRFARANHALVAWAVKFKFRRELEDLPVKVTPEVEAEIIAEIFSDETNGLLRAINDFDPDRDMRFSTYAVYWLRRSVQLYVVKNMPVPISVYAHRKLRRLRKVNGKAEYRKQHPEMTFSEDILGLNGTTFLSFDEKVLLDDDEQSTYAGIEADPRSMQPEMDVDARLTLETALSELNPLQRSIITQQFGLDGSQPKTQQALASEFGVSRDYIRVQQLAAMEALRPHFAAFRD